MTTRSIEAVTPKLGTFTPRRCARALVVSPARSADSIKRLARVVPTVTLVALRLWTLLITTMLGLRCRNECKVRVKLSFRPGPMPIRPTFLTPTLIGLLVAETPTLMAPRTPSLAHSDMAPFELAGLAIRTTFRGRPSVVTNRAPRLGLQLSVLTFTRVSDGLRTWTIIPLFYKAGKAPIWKLTDPSPDKCTPTCLLRGCWCLETLRSVTIPSCVVTCLVSRTGGPVILCRTLLACTCIWQPPLQGLKRKLDELSPTVLSSTPRMKCIIGVLLVLRLVTELRRPLLIDLMLRLLRLMLVTLLRLSARSLKNPLTVLSSPLLLIRTVLASRLASNRTLPTVRRPAGLETFMNSPPLCC